MSFQVLFIVICCLTCPVVGLRIATNTDQHPGLIPRFYSTSESRASTRVNRVKKTVGSEIENERQRFAVVADTHLRRSPLPPPPPPGRDSSSATMDLREHRLFNSDISLDCCPTTTVQTHRATAINWHGIIIELLQTENFTHSFYETVCRPEFKDRPCQYVDPKLVSASRCVQQYNYAYAVGRPIGSDEQFRIELIRVASGCKCRLTAAALHLNIEELATLAESARERLAQYVDRFRTAGRPTPATWSSRNGDVSLSAGGNKLGRNNQRTGGSGQRRPNVEYLEVGGERRRGHGKPAPGNASPGNADRANRYTGGHRYHTEQDAQHEEHRKPPPASFDISSFLKPVESSASRVSGETQLADSDIGEHGEERNIFNVDLPDAGNPDNPVTDGEEKASSKGEPGNDDSAKADDDDNQALSLVTSPTSADGAEHVDQDDVIIPERGDDLHDVEGFRSVDGPESKHRKSNGEVDYNQHGVRITEPIGLMRDWKSF